MLNYTSSYHIGRHVRRDLNKLLNSGLGVNAQMACTVYYVFKERMGGKYEMDEANLEIHNDRILNDPIDMQHLAHTEILVLSLFVTRWSCHYS